MRLKIFIQFFLLFIIILISSIIYQNYFNKIETNSLNGVNEKINHSEGNVIKELEYESSDDIGRKYIINSDEGIIDKNDSDIVLMKKVKARIVFADGSVVYISSDKAKYNNKSFNTNFEKNINLNFLNHDLTSQNLDLFFDKNKIEVYNNLIYKNSDLTMTADKIEIDMLTKFSKIFTYDESKVKIEKIIK